MRIGRLVLFAFLAPGLAAAQDLPPEVLLLARVKARLREALAKLPDYACLETIQRFHKRPGQQLEPLDTIRLEVLYAGGSEFYGSPGGRRFGEENPSAFIASGAIENGAFALHLKTVFLNGHAVIRYSGEEDLAGRRTARYDYVISPVFSGYQIESDGSSGVAGMKGSAWVDPQSLDMRRLEVRAYEIPPTVPVEDVASVVNYAPMQIGGASLVLPQSGSLALRKASGEEDRNLLEFTQCRAFRAESTIRFGEAPETGESVVEGRGATAVRAEAGRLLPAGIPVTVALAAPVNERLFVGAVLEGRTAEAVVSRGEILISQGAAVRGRVRRLEHHAEGDYFAVGVEFTEIDTGAATFRFYADLRSVDPLPGFEWTLPESKTVTREVGPGVRIWSTNGSTVSLPDLPGVGSFFIRGDRFELPKGFKTVWRTLSPK
ncbi:MAG: hypothetical protein LAQ30_24685 [Acidobacteriia bacterium]|nr:hypothetical protein [Terriglobia bacterium]